MFFATAAVVLFFVPHSYAIERQSEKVVTKNYAEQFIREVARKNGIGEYIFVETARCESNFLIDAKGDNGLAYGVFQFHKKSWDFFNRKFGTKLDYYNWQHSVELAGLAFKRGYEKHWWNCWLKTVRLAGDVK